MGECEFKDTVILCLYIQIRMYCIVDALQIVLRDLEYICSASLEWG